MAEPNVLPAGEDDREWAAQLMAQSEPWTTLGRTLEACRPVFNDRELEVFIAWVDGQRCGFLVLDPRGVAGAPYLKSLAVDPAFRDRGLGTALVGFVEAHYRPSATHLFLCVSSFNDRARQLYERLGYAHVGELKGFAADDASELLMMKRLK